MTRHQYGFLRLFLRHHITGEQVVLPQNLGCFFRLSVGWVPLALLSHLVLTFDYKNYMMFSNSPSGVSVNNVHGGTLWECYQIYNRIIQHWLLSVGTFLYYYQKKKQLYILQGVKSTQWHAKCRQQISYHLKAWQDTCLITKAVKCTLICLQRKRKKIVLKVKALYRPATPTVAAPAPINLAAESTSCTWELVWKPRQARAKGEEGTTACTGKE